MIARQVFKAALALILILGFGTVAAADMYVVARGTKYKNVVTVAKSGGNFTGIQAALDSIADASSDNRYLVVVGPGTYQEKVQLRPWVDVTGAGRGITIITSPGDTYEPEATVSGEDNTELSHLTVANTGGSSYAIGIYNLGASPRIHHVDILVTGGGSYQTVGMVNNVASPELSDLAIEVSGLSSGGSVSGIYNFSSSSPTIRDTTIKVDTSSGAATLAYGLRNWQGAAPVASNLEISVTGGTSPTEAAGVKCADNSPAVISQSRIQVSGGATNAYGVYGDSSSYQLINCMVEITAGSTGDNFGVYNDNTANAVLSKVSIQVTGATSGSNVGVCNDAAGALLTDLMIYASGAASNNYGVYNQSSSPDMKHCSISVDNASGVAVGINNDATSRPRISYCHVLGGHIGLRNHNGSSSADPVIVLNTRLMGSDNALYNEANFTTNVTGCILDGPRTIAGGTVNCADCYNQEASAVTCP